jgi:hypothetical protein
MAAASLRPDHYVPTSFFVASVTRMVGVWGCAKGFILGHTPRCCFPAVTAALRSAR